MSQRHQDRFDTIKDEHEQVTGLLSALARKGTKTGLGRRGRLSPLPPFSPAALQAAVGTANDAYALLLIATAERFLREYLASLGIAFPNDRQLHTLINKARKEFNGTNPRVPIAQAAADDFHNLRVQRNAYAHGHGPAGFPTVPRIVSIPGRFFHGIP